MLKNKNKIVVGGNSVWLYLCSWWVYGCVHRYICWHAVLFALITNSKKSFRFDTSWLLLVQTFCFFKPVCILQKVLFAMTCQLPSRASAGRLCLFFLLACIHTEIGAFCIHMSIWGYIIHLRKKVKTEWSFSFQMLCLEVCFLLPAVIENCLFFIVFISYYVVFNQSSLITLGQKGHLGLSATNLPLNKEP